jgi:Protein of unknown function (DUF2505)
VREVDEEFHYDAAVEAVFALIASGAFQAELTEHLGGRNVTVVEETATPASTKIVVSQQIAVELPGFAKKFVPANANVTQAHEWGPPDAGGNRTGSWSAVTKGAPVSIGGPTELIATPEGGTVHRYSGQIKASVPLVGGKLESFAFDNLHKDLAISHDYIAARLAEQVQGNES